MKNTLSSLVLEEIRTGLKHNLNVHNNNVNDDNTVVVETSHYVYLINIALQLDNSYILTTKRINSKYKQPHIRVENYSSLKLVIKKIISIIELVNQINHPQQELEKC